MGFILILVVFMINSKDVIDKENCNNDLYSYIVNCMKVFTPAKIEHNSKVIHIKLTAENKNISANRLELPSDYHDALNVKEVVE